MGRPVEPQEYKKARQAAIEVSIPDFMGRPVEQRINQVTLNEPKGFNPRFYGEAGRTR